MSDELAVRVEGVAGYNGSCKHVPHPGVGAACHACVFALVQREVAAERERCAMVVPRTWLDPLLSGDRAVIGHPPHDNQAIERLCRAIAAAIRAEEPRDG